MWNVGQPERAEALHEEHLAVCRALGDEHGMAQAHLHACFVAEWRGDQERVRDNATTALALAGGSQKAYVAAWANMVLFGQAFQRGELERAETLVGEALRLFREADPAGTTSSAHAPHLALARLAQRRGDTAQALAHYEEGLRLAREGRQVNEQGRMLRRLGYFFLRQGEPQRAGALLREALGRLRDGGALHNTPACLVGLAGVATAQGRPEDAARLCGAATAALETRYGRAVPADSGDVEDFERIVGTARASLDARPCAVAWAEGGALPLEEAVEEALSAAPLRRCPRRGAGTVTGTGGR